MNRCRAAFAVFSALGAATAAPAPVLAATATPSPAAADDMPMADYLALLAQIAPAASEAAQVYLRAFQSRCGYAMATARLRRAMADGDGDPVLMAMIRASHLRDAPGLDRLRDQVLCNRLVRP